MSDMKNNFSSVFIFLCWNFTNVIILQAIRQRRLYMFLNLVMFFRYKTIGVNSSLLYYSMLNNTRYKLL